MKNPSPPTDSLTHTLRQTALAHPNVEEGIACNGTALESATYKVRGKAFLFVRPAKAMVKLQTSLHEATKLANENPARCKVGSAGWVTIELSDAGNVSTEILTRWIDESYALFAAGNKPTKARLKTT